MTISKIGRSIGESATLKINAQAKALKAKGEPVIHLGGGEPKSKAPIGALKAAADLLETGEVRYTPADGAPDIKAAVIKYTQEFYGRTATPDMVMVSGGAKQAIMCCLQAVLDPGDEVVFPAPYWVSYPEMTKLTGAVPVVVPHHDASFVPRIEDIAGHVGPRTRAMIINSPNNPSGAVYPDEVIGAIVSFCEEKKITLIMDDIYNRLVFGNIRVPNVFDHVKASDGESRLVIVNGVSKVYAMTGFRIGWAVGNPEIIGVAANIQSHQTSGPSTVSQKAAVGAINGDQSGVEELIVDLEKNRDLMTKLLRDFPGVKFVEPDGAFFCLVDFSSYDADSARLAEFLLEKVLVVTVPGVEFGVDGYLRLSTSGASEDIVEGVARIRWALDPAAPKEYRIGDRTLTRDW